MKKYMRFPALFLVGATFATSTMASSCKDLPTAGELKKALQVVVPIDTVDLKTGVSQNPMANGGVGAPEWLAMVDSSGIVCAVVHSLPNGTDVTTQMGLIHRPFAAQVASTANSYSRAGIGVSTANLYLHAANSPGFDAEINSGAEGAYNFGINPYEGNPDHWGTPKDPYVGKRVGGANFQAGGLPLYNNKKVKVGAIGVSGDFRCTDHVVAWKVREMLHNGAYTATNNPFGLSSNHTDAMIQDIDPKTGKSASGFGYPVCLINNPTNDNDADAIEGND